MFRVESISNPQTVYAATAPGLVAIGVDPDSGSDFQWSRQRGMSNTGLSSGVGPFLVVLRAGDQVIVDGGSDGDAYVFKLGDAV